MTVMLSIHAGYDVGYLTNAVGDGVDYYLSAAGRNGEPAGFWTGKGAGHLGLRGQVDADVMRNLYHHDIGPDGELLVANRRHGYQAMADSVEDRIEAEVVRRIAELGTEPTTQELTDIRLMVASQVRNAVPFFDFTLSMAKSISVAHASYLAAAKAAHDAGDEAEFARCKAKADAIEDAACEGARQVVRSIEAHAAYVRTGHHGEGTGQWRDAAGVTAACFPQHTSRDGDPQLHVHTAVLNRARRADGADDKYRTLDSRSLHRERLGIAARAGMVVEQRLLAAGFQLVQREDGNGREIGGVEPATMRAFSSRRVALTPVLQRLVDEYTESRGRAPSRRVLWSLRQWATLETRRGKHEIERTVGESLAAWDAKSRADEVQVLAEVHRAVEEFGASGAPSAPCTDDMHRAIRIAVHEVQRQNATWSASQLAWELFRAMPPRDAATDPVPLLEAMLTEALTTDMVDVVPLAPAPDVTDVSVLGVRASDGASVYRPPGEARFCTAGHLDVEKYLIDSARRKVRQRVTEAEAEAEVRRLGLTGNQAEVVKGLLTTGTAFTVLVGPPGTGKSYVMAKFAEGWRRLTGCRVIGLATSTNAARVLQGEGLAESYNIADFLGKIKDSDATRGNIRVNPGDVLVVDESSQVSTEDLLAIRLVAERNGCTVVGTGDPAQLSAVEAGGIVAEIARHQGAWKLHEVRRFRHAWERAASLRLRDGDIKAWGEYQAHGRVRGGPQDVAYALAVRMWVTDFVKGRDTLLMAGSNAEAAELARLARETLIAWRQVPGRNEVVLSDGNDAGRGDLVRARQNAKDIDAGGRPLTNRDTLRIVSVGAETATVERQQADRSWSEDFTVPVDYLRENTELAYAGNVFTAQGRTVDTGHLVASETLSRESSLVGMTRGREVNMVYPVTGPAQGRMKEPVQQAPAEAVLASALDREAAQATATQTIRDAQQFATSTRHLFELWRGLLRHESVGAIDQAVRERLPEAEFQRYMQDPERPVLHLRLREAELAGHSVPEVLDQVTRKSWTGARSIAATMHGRVEKLGRAVRGATATWAERTPRPREAEADREPEPSGDTGQAWTPTEAEAGAWRRALDEVVAALDHRQLELGLGLLDHPEPWVVRYLGMPPAEAGAERDDWMARAGQAASYREAAGHTDPEQAVGPAPRNNPELHEAYMAAVRALEMQEEETTRSLPRGALEAKVGEYERVRAWAPQPVGRDLEAAEAARQDAETQAAEARARGDAELAASAEELERAMADDKATLEVQRAARLEWEEATAGEREQARVARAELQRRGHDEAEVDEPEPSRYEVPEVDEAEAQSLVEWWAEFERDASAAEQALERERAEAEAANFVNNINEVEADAEAASSVDNVNTVDEPEPEAEAEAETLAGWWREINDPAPERAEAEVGETGQSDQFDQPEPEPAVREEAERFEVDQSRERAWQEPEIKQPEAEMDEPELEIGF